jgi:hypothetical protein
MVSSQQATKDIQLPPLVLGLRPDNQMLPPQAQLIVSDAPALASSSIDIVPTLFHILEVFWVQTTPRDALHVTQ